MAELDLAVLRHLDKWLRQHRERLPALARISINIDGQSLASRAFAHEFLSLLDQFALPPQTLCFEVTETAAITHAQKSTALVSAVRERGCHVAIDDFGVGYQSFERLTQIPVDVIKIDGSFARDMFPSPRYTELVRATVAIALAFNAEMGGRCGNHRRAAGAGRGLGTWFSYRQTRSDRRRAAGTRPRYVGDADAHIPLSACGSVGAIGDDGFKTIDENSVHSAQLEHTDGGRKPDHTQKHC